MEERQKWSTQNDWKHNSKDECNILSKHFSSFAPFADAAVSSATIERSHSSLKSIKTKQRATIGEEHRLNALILFHIHKDIMLNYGTIIDMYIRQNPRKMKLIYPLEDTENESKSVWQSQDIF